jgi:hypothetical protein
MLYYRKSIRVYEELWFTNAGFRKLLSLLFAMICGLQNSRLLLQWSIPDKHLSFHWPQFITKVLYRCGSHTFISIFKMWLSPIFQGQVFWSSNNQSTGHKRTDLSKLNVENTPGWIKYSLEFMNYLIYEWGWVASVVLLKWCRGVQHSTPPIKLHIK